MKILVTGGAGFIGSHLTEHLLQRGHEVTALDDLSNGHRSFLERALRWPGCKFVEDTVLDEHVVHQLVQDHDAVFHLAAVLGVRNCVEDPLKVIESNILGTRNVASACHKWGKKLVFASTSEVYGKNVHLPFGEDADRVLGATTIHRWCYATAKALDEHLCLAYAKRDLRVTILRYFNVYGPRAVATPYAGVIPTMIDAALRGGVVQVHGDGTQTRCFTYVSDAIQATMAALSPKADGFVINIGTSEEIPVRELAETIVHLCGSRAQITYIPYQKVYGPGYEDSPRRVPELTRQEQILGYQPRVSLEQGLLTTIRWHRDWRGEVCAHAI